MRMLRIFQAILLVAAIGFAASGLRYGQQTHGVFPGGHPNNDPRFQDIVDSQKRGGFDMVMASVNPQTAVEREYSVAIERYDRQVADFNEKKSEAKHNSENSFIGAFVSGFFFLLFLLPWEAWRLQAEKRVSSTAREISKSISHGIITIRSQTVKSPIVGRYGFKTYSVADELLKWNTLRQDGVVTEAEFVEARKRLLNDGTYSRGSK